MPGACGSAASSCEERYAFIRFHRSDRGGDQGGTKTEPDDGSQPEKASEWVLQSTDGSRVALYDLKGKVVIIDFWAIWCTTCKPELQELSQLQEKLIDDVVVVAIGVDSGDMKFLKEFHAYLDLSFPLLFGKKHQIKRILRDYGNIRQIPSIIIINREGRR